MTNKEALMSNKEALEIVLELANAHPAVDAGVDNHGHGLTIKEKIALDQMEDYYNDVMEDNTDDSAFPPMEN